jgi:hypothetical protein
MKTEYEIVLVIILMAKFLENEREIERKIIKNSEIGIIMMRIENS